MQIIIKNHFLVLALIKYMSASQHCKQISIVIVIISFLILNKCVLSCLRFY